MTEHHPSDIGQGPEALAQPAELADLARAQALFESGEYLLAETEVRALLQTEPDNPGALYLLGRLADVAGQHGPAIALIGQALDGDPHQPRWYLSLMQLLQHTGQPEVAVRVYDLAREHGAADIALMAGRAALLLDLGRTDEALAAYGEALAARPDAPEVYLGIAQLLETSLDHPGLDAWLAGLPESGLGRAFVMIRYHQLRGEPDLARDCALQALSNQDDPLLREAVAAFGSAADSSQALQARLAQVMEQLGQGRHQT